MAISNEILGFFAKFIEKELGIIYAEHNYFQLQNRLEEIATNLKLGTVEKLYDEAKGGFSLQLKQLLLDTATNNETSFFRDPKIFTALESAVLNEDFLKAQPDKFRIWSAASSTGQEALSVAMMITEFKEKFKSAREFEIIATDISERALMKAQSATYTQLEVQRGLPSLFIDKYFKKNENNQWKANPQLAQKIEFKKLNLKEPFPFTLKFDLVLCRNVLIYQNVEGKKAILNRITQVLAPNGHLVLGSGESLLGLSQDYNQRSVDGAIIYQKKIADFSSENAA